MEGHLFHRDTQASSKKSEKIFTKKQAVEFFVKNGVLVTPLLLSQFGDTLTQEDLNQLLSPNPFSEPIAQLSLMQQGISSTIIPDAIQIENSISHASTALPFQSVKVIVSYKENLKKREVQDFVAYFNKRHAAIKSLLQNRQELQNLTSIGRLANKAERESAAIIGIITAKRETVNKNIMLTLEDQTGVINVLINQNKLDILAKGKESVLDEVIGITGMCGKNLLFADNIVRPDIPLSKELKKCPEDVCAVFLSDIHVGSDNFLPEEFGKFLSWIKGESGSQNQKEMAAKVRYVFIAGDLVDGVGIYPGQENELHLQDIYEQYKECARLLKEIPKHIQIIICPGNHDAGRIAEPQPILSETIAAPLWQMENVTLTSNPAFINIHESDSFPGFDVLLYHGYSFDYYVANVDTIREGGGYDRADLIMKFLLQRRHLAPTHTSTLYIPDNKHDPLVITKVPDFFVTGHIHKASVSNYRNITMICGSCWQAKTAFQERVGHHPEPCRVPVVNLKTRQVKMLRFDAIEEESKNEKQEAIKNEKQETTKNEEEIISKEELTQVEKKIILPSSSEGKDSLTLVNGSGIHG